MLAKRENKIEDNFRTTIWDPYNQQKKLGLSTLSDQTELFFRAIPSEQKDEFHSSTKGVIQLGISTGDYLTQFGSLSTRRIIGYDYSQVAINHVSEKGVIGRLVNLNEIDTNNDKRLGYHDLLEADLFVSQAVLIIRTLEYLNPEAVKLLIFSLLDFSKPGTKFYLEIFTAKSKDAAKQSSLREFHHNLQPGYIPSFFAPRTDIKFLSLTVSKNEEENKCSGDDTATERVILEKTFF